MPNQYSALTAANIIRKMTRRRNPVRSMTQLAREFGIHTEYSRWDGTTGNAAPESFRRKVKGLVGESVYKRIRHASSVNVSYR